MTTNTQPIKLGQELKVTIESIGEKGDGIAKHEEFVIITPNTQLDQEYNIKITKIFRTWALAERTDKKEEETQNDI